MTPMELLEDVKARFALLLLHDEGQMQRLLRQALRTYQDKAGYLKAFTLQTLPVASHNIPVPSDALEPIWGEDARGVMIPITEVEQDSGGVMTPMWALEMHPRHRPPYVVRYFVDLMGMDYQNDHLPRGTTGLIGDYLYALIDIVNTVRHRQVNQSSGLPFDHLRADTELQQAKLDIELAMQEQQEILPAVVAA